MSDEQFEKLASGERKLRLEIIWKDDDMVELQAFASNGRYSGTTEIYTTSEHLLELANSIQGFPKRVEDAVEFRAGETDSYAFLSLRFYCIDGAGHTAVLVSMEENVPNDFRPAEKDRVCLELEYEPGCIDQFQKDIFQMALNKTGFALLG